MKHAVYAPIFNDYGDPRKLVELAVTAEQAGYDGFFIWDHLVFEPDGQLEVVDATVTLAAIAQATARLRIGAMITPLARRRPWKFAREMVTLDHLSGGRVTIGVGLGEPAELEFAAFGEDASARGRAGRLDEGLHIARGLMRGERVEYAGSYFDVAGARFSPAALQQPQIPVWVAATLPARAGVRRALRHDGVFPVQLPAAMQGGDEPEVDSSIDWSEWWLDAEAFAALVDEIGRTRDPAGFDLIASGRPGTAAGVIEDFAASGATWWFEWVAEQPGSFDDTLECIRRGPGGL